MKVRATWQGAVLAESDETILIEGNHYFPPEAISDAYFVSNLSQTVCVRKGMASYYDVVVDGNRNPSAAWFYPNPSPAASEIQNYVAFWKGVRVEEVAD